MRLGIIFDIESAHFGNRRSPCGIRTLAAARFHGVFDIAPMLISVFHMAGFMIDQRRHVPPPCFSQSGRNAFLIMEVRQYNGDVKAEFQMREVAFSIRTTWPMP